MKTHRWMLPLGMIGVLSFLLLNLLGQALWPQYHSVTSYTSELVADTSPHHNLMKVFLNVYTICFCLFCIAMAALSFKRYHKEVFSGYLILCALAFISVLGYGAVPISADLLFAANDLIHLAVTILLLAGAISGLLLIGNGYRAKERLRNTGRIVLVLAAAYVLLNLWHVLAILSGSHILGLIQRLTFLVFDLFTFFISMIYTFPKKFARLI